MLGLLRNVLGLQSQASPFPLMPSAAPFAAPIEAPLPVASDALPATNEDAVVANDNDPVETANRILKEALGQAEIKGAQMGNVTLPAQRLLIKSLHLGGPDDKRGMVVSYAGNEIATLTLTLAGNAGRYDMQALNDRVHRVIAAIPGFEGHVKTQPINENTQHVSDVQAKLAPLLSGLDGETRAMLDAWFERNKGDEIQWNGCRTVKADHAEGFVTIGLRPAYDLVGAEKTGSEDGQIKAYVTTHKEALLAAFKAKIGALNVIDAAELEKLDFDVEIAKGSEGYDRDSRTTLTFGLRNGDKLEKTTLAEKVNTSVLEENFRKVLLETGKPAEIFPILADGATVGEILHAKLPASPELDAALDHNKFKNREQAGEEAKAEAEGKQVTLSNIVETNRPDELSLTLNLPHNMTLAQMRSNIAAAAPAILEAGSQELGLAA